MSGNPAFQGNAFQNTAFQAGLTVVASTYSLGSPAFAAPALTTNYVFSAPAYSLGPLSIPVVGKVVYAFNVFTYSLGPLGWTPVGPLHFNYHFSITSYSVGSPAFAKPAVAQYPPGGYYTLHANPYSLGALAWTLPPIRQILQRLQVGAYSLGPLGFVPVQIVQNYRIFINAWATGSPIFASNLVIGFNYHIAPASYSLGPLFWSPVGPIIVNYTLAVNAYSLGSPAPDYPRLQWSVVRLDLPPTYLSQLEQATNVLVGMLNTLLSSIPPSPTKERDTVRALINTLRTTADVAIRGNTLGTQLQVIFNACVPAGATLAGAEATRQYLMSQAGNTSPFSQIVFRAGLVMTLALESQIIASMSFTNQNDIVSMIQQMSAAFDAAKAVGVDDVDVGVYQTLNAMGGALINHLARSELQLPRYMTYVSGMPMPSLYLANRIYADEVSNIDTRAREIERENGVVNPAFCPRILRVLSTVTPGVATS